MRYITIILALLFFNSLNAQIKFGTYSQIDTLIYANLKIFSNNKFDFYDTRSNSCWVWGHYKGKWKVRKDTLIFSWHSQSSEASDSVILETDLKNDYTELRFSYDDGKPISNAKTSLGCNSENNPKYYYSNTDGKVIIPKKISPDSNKRTCPIYSRMLYYEIKNGNKISSSNMSIDHIADSSNNIFIIIIKRNPKTYTYISTKKYLIKGTTLIDIDLKEYYELNWGNFKFTKSGYDN